MYVVCSVVRWLLLGIVEKKKLVLFSLGWQYFLLCNGPEGPDN